MLRYLCGFLVSFSCSLIGDRTAAASFAAAAVCAVEASYKTMAVEVVVAVKGNGNRVGQVESGDIRDGRRWRTKVVAKVAVAGARGLAGWVAVEEKTDNGWEKRWWLRMAEFAVVRRLR